MQHNEKVKKTGTGTLHEVRETDVSVKAARKRYKVFSEQALEALQSLKKEFPYHVIDGLLSYPVSILFTYFFSLWNH